MTKYHIDGDGVTPLIEPQVGELQETAVIKPSPFEHPTYDEPECIPGTLIVRDRNTKEYVYFSDVSYYGNRSELNEHEDIKIEMEFTGITDELDQDWEPMPGHEDRFESVFLDA